MLTRTLIRSLVPLLDDLNLTCCEECADTRETLLRLVQRLTGHTTGWPQMKSKMVVD